MKVLSLVRHNLREKFFHDALMQASKALENRSQNESDSFFLSFWKLVAAAIISSTDLDIVHSLESLKNENPTFDYAIICVQIWIEECKQENTDPKFLENIERFHKISEKSAPQESIILAAEFFMYVERITQASNCLLRVHHQMYQVIEPNETINNLFRVSASLYTISNGNSHVPLDKFEMVLKGGNGLDLDCVLALGRYYAHCDEIEKAKDLLKYAIEYDTYYFPAYVELSTLLFLQNDFEGALHYAENATQYCDGDLACMHHSVVLSLQLGKYEAAHDYLNTMVQEILKFETPMHSQFSTRLCRTVCQVSNYDKESIELCIGLMAHICESDPENTQLRLHFAHLLRCAKRYDQAISLYEFISSFDENLDALEGLLLTNALKGNTEEAKHQLELYYLMAENNQRTPLNTVLASILITGGSFEKAINAVSEHFEQHFASDKVVTNIDISTIVLISKTILFKYRYELPTNIQQLLQILRKISKRYINHEMVLILAKLHLELDDIDGAMDTIKFFLKNHSSSESIRILETHALLGFGDIEKANAAVKKIVGGDATYHADLYFNALKGWLRFLEQRGEEGKLLVQPILFDSHPGSFEITWGDRKRCLLFYGHCSQLNDEEIKKILPVVDSEAQHSKCFELIYLLSQLQVKVGSVENALKVFDSMPKASLDYKKAQHAKAWLLLNKMEDKHGFLEIFKSIAKEEKSLESFVHLGRAHLKIGNNTEALSSYRHAFSLCTEKEDTAIKICNDIMVSQTNHDLAIDFCKCHLDDFPKHLRVKLLMADIFKRKGEYVISLNVYNDILSAWDDGLYSVLDKIDIQKAAASIYLDTGETEIALELLYEARDLCSISISDANHPDSLRAELFHIQINISQISMAQKNFIQAITSLKDALDLGGYDDINVLKMLVVSCFECKLYEECDLYCQQLLALDPNDKNILQFRNRIQASVLCV